MTVEERLSALETAFASMMSAEGPSGYYTSKYTGDEIDVELGKIASKADLIGDQVPYSQSPRLTAQRTLYVNAATGNDENSGTSSAKPFKTIQAAVDSLPKDLGKSGVVINVAEGVYDNEVIISGFFGGKSYRPFTIKGAGQKDETRKVGRFSITNNAAMIRLEGLFVSGYTGASSASIEVSSSVCQLYQIKLEQDGSVTYGVAVGSNAPGSAYISDVEADGYSRGGVLVNYASLVSANVVKTKNCGVGIAAISGILMGISLSYESNTTNSSTSGGGQIFLPT